MSEKWTDHTLDNPAQKLPCARPLELFVSKIEQELRPGGDRKCCTEEIARMLCSEFNLKPPVLGEKIRTFFEMAGIYHDVAPCSGETTFIPNPSMSRWEIHTRPCATYEWSREVWHEVWEILFWRCFHRITWWKKWAAQNGCYCPHDKADDFAYHILLSPRSVSAQAKKRQYDLYEVAKYYSVPTTFAFRALQTSTHFSHPLIFAVLRLNVRPRTISQHSLDDSLFADPERTLNVVHAEISHKIKKGKYLVDTEMPLSREQQTKWCAVESTFEMLSKYLRKGVFQQIDAEDPVYLYSLQPEPRQWTLSHLFGLDLTTDVTVITRQSPRYSNEIFLQIMPPEEASNFLISPDRVASPEELLQHFIRKDWQQAASGIIKGTARYSVPAV